MGNVHHFFFHTLVGRMILVAVFLVVALIVASVAGWLPELQ